MKNQASRRTFLRHLGLGMTSMAFLGTSSCGNGGPESSEKNTEEAADAASTSAGDLFFQISLAQWSLHRAFEAGDLKPENFAAIAKNQFQIDAVEYVNGFYMEKGGNDAFFRDLNARAKDNGVRNLLIMVDDEGELGNTDDAMRKQAVENHYKWVEAAKIMGCHSIRINAFGEGSAEAVSTALVDGLGTLCEYAQKEGINVAIENHGLYSSNAKWVANVIRQVNMDNCGTLPDFGNFCTAKKWGSTQNNDCEESYDRYLGVREMMPFAVGVSAKSYDFDENGNETIIDYYKMLEIVNQAGYTGHVGIEYEGERLSEPEGIRATRALLEKAGAAVANGG